MKRWIVALVTVSVLAVASARAEEGKPGKGPEGHRRGPEMAGMLLPSRALESLQLTADQKAKYDEISGRYAKEQKAWADSHKADREQSMKEMEAAKGDEAKMKELREKMRERWAPMQEMRKKYTDEFRATLTAEQQAKLDQMREEMKARIAQGGSRPGGAAHGHGAPKEK